MRLPVAIENNAGGRVDCLQNVYGGTDLTFSYNYEDDNECQSFFRKDGDVANVTFDENLFLRDDLGATNGGSSFSSSQIYNTSNLMAQNNTVWDSKDLTLRCASSVPCTGRPSSITMQSGCSMTATAAMQPASS